MEFRYAIFLDDDKTVINISFPGFGGTLMEDIADSSPKLIPSPEELVGLFFKTELALQ